jgi:hypothetical protein
MPKAPRYLPVAFSGGGINAEQKECNAASRFLASASLDAGTLLPAVMCFVTELEKMQLE